jgi:hypothetical protein
MEEPGSAWLGLPAMIALLVVIAAYTATNSLLGILLAVVGVVVLFLVIGFAITIAKR